MSTERKTPEGEAFVSLETVAEIFEVRTTWVRLVFEQGLLGPTRGSNTEARIAVTQFDRVARIVRLHQYYGLDWDAIGLLLEVEFPADD